MFLFEESNISNAYDDCIRMELHCSFEFVNRFFHLDDSSCTVFLFFYRGKASKNANFELLPNNWRDRLKKRKTTNKT